MTDVIMRTEVLTRQRGAQVSISVAVIMAFALCFLPLLYMLACSLEINGRFSLFYYTQLLGDSRQRQLIRTSVGLATGAALFASALGLPAGFLLARLSNSSATLFRFVLLVPLVLPPYILAVVWIFLVGHAGLIRRLIGMEVISNWAHGLASASLVLGIAFAPVAMLISEAARRAISPRLIDAARLVASPWRTIRRITIPVVASAVMAAILIIFVLSIAEFGVPSLLGVRVYTTEVFTRFASFYNFAAATAAAIPLLVVVLLAASLVRVLLGERATTSNFYSQERSTLPMATRVAAYGYLTALSLLVVGTPLYVLVREAASWVSFMDSLMAARPQIITSVALSLTSATIAAGVGLLLGYWRARSVSSWRGFLDIGMVAIFAVPSTVTGIGLIGLWNRSGWPGTIYSTPAIIVIGYVARYLPLAVLLLGAYLQHLPASHEEAALMFGTKWGRLLRGVIIPRARLGLVSVGTLCFIFMFGELGTTLLIAPPGTTTLPMRVYALLANSPDHRIAELCLMQTLVILLSLGVLLLITVAARKRSGRRGDESHG